MIIDFTFMDIEKNWPDVLTSIYTVDKMLHALIQRTKPRRLWGGLDGQDTPILTLSVPYPYHATQLQARHADIERAILIRTGIAVTVKPLYRPHETQPITQDS